MKNVIRIIVGCFCGGFIGTVVARQYLPGWTFVSMMVGGVVGYTTCEPKGFFQGLWRAIRESAASFIGRNWALRRQWFRKQLKESCILTYEITIFVMEVVLGLCVIGDILSYIDNRPLGLMNQVKFLGFLYGLIPTISFFVWLAVMVIMFFSKKEDRFFHFSMGDWDPYTMHCNDGSRWSTWGVVVRSMYPGVFLRYLCLLVGWFLTQLPLIVRVLLISLAKVIALTVRYTANHIRFVCLIGGAAGVYMGSMVASPIVGGLVGVIVGLGCNLVACRIEPYICEPSLGKSTT